MPRLLLSAADDVTNGVVSDVTAAATVGAGCALTSFVDRTTADPEVVTFDPSTCDDPVVLLAATAAAAECLALVLVDNSAFSLSILAASFFTV